MPDTVRWAGSSRLEEKSNQVNRTRAQGQPTIFDFVDLDLVFSLFRLTFVFDRETHTHTVRAYHRHITNTIG